MKDSSESNDGRNIRDFDLNIPLPGLGVGGGSDYCGNVKVKFPPREQEIIDLSGSSPEIFEPPTSKVITRSFHLSHIRSLIINEKKIIVK